MCETIIQADFEAFEDHVVQHFIREEQDLSDFKSDDSKEDSISDATLKTLHFVSQMNST